MKVRSIFIRSLAILNVGLTFITLSKGMLVGKASDVIIHILEAEFGLVLISAIITGACAFLAKEE